MYVLMETDGEKKSDYAESVLGGMGIYIATMIISLCFWVKGCIQSSSGSGRPDSYGDMGKPGSMVRQHGSI
jgi:hypothetical protein